MQVKFLYAGDPVGRLCAGDPGFPEDCMGQPPEIRGPTAACTIPVTRVSNDMVGVQI